MKAIAVEPGKPDSVHLADLAKPSVDDVPGGRGVLVKVLRVGVDGTDKEINAAEYGAAPPGHAFLVIGHEGFGQVEAVGPNVSEIKPGDFVVATVRRPGSSLYDLIGTSDMTTDDTYFERGINLRHGFLTEYYVDDAEFIVKVPQGLREVGVLLEPLTVVEKGIAQAYEIQRRLRVWRPRRAAVMGAGTIGILATLVLRLRGLAVTTFGLTRKPYLNSDLIEAIGARYESTADLPILDGAREHGPFDLIVSNPPYIRRGEIAELAPTVSRWEPRVALDGGPDGLDYYRRLAAAAMEYLLPNGAVIVEIGADMAVSVRALFTNAAACVDATIAQDYSGQDRIVVARYRASLEN